METNHFNEELSYLTMQNKVLHDTATFQVNLFKNVLSNKECWTGKKQRLTLDRSLLLGFVEFEWSVSFSPSVTSFPCLLPRQCPG